MYISHDYEISAVGGCGSCGAQGQPSATTYPDGRKIYNRYDNLDRLISRAYDDGSGGTFTPLASYQYIGRNRVATVTYQNDTRLTYIGQTHGTNVDVGYDGLRRIVNKRWEKANGQPLGQSDLIVGFNHQNSNGNPTYDRMNNKLIEEKLHDTGNSEAYSYDSVYRLTTFDRGVLNTARDAITTPTTLPGAMQAQSWTLDGVGNWIDSSHTTGGVTGTETRTHTDYSEIYSIAGTPLPGNVVGAQQFDKNGNLIDDGIRLMKWDALNRLREVARKSDGLTIAKYTYGSSNRRFRKEVMNGGIENDPGINGMTDFYYNGWQVLEEREPNLVASQATNKILRQYVYGLYIDEPLVIDDRSGGKTIADLNDNVGAERLFYHQNTLHSVFAITDETGIILEGYQYDTYGSQTVFEPGSNGIVDFGGDDMVIASGLSNFYNAYSFTGRRYDPETGLHYYRARYMNTAQGVFLSRDPIGFAGTLNVYQYVYSNPINAVDPQGQWVLCVGASAGGAYFLGAGVGIYYCADDCGNWAWVWTPNFRIGMGGSVGAGARVSEGGLKGYLGSFIDVDVAAGVVSVSPDATVDFSQGHGRVTRVGIGVEAGPGAGITAGIGTVKVITGDLTIPWPCPPCPPCPPSTDELKTTTRRQKPKPTKQRPKPPPAVKCANLIRCGASQRDIKKELERAKRHEKAVKRAKWYKEHGITTPEELRPWETPWQRR